MLTIKQITTIERFQEVCAKAAADGHAIVPPTHALMKGDEIVGALTFVSSPLIWMDTKKCQARDAVQLENLLLSHLQLEGKQQIMCVPCTEASPFHSFLTAKQYINSGKYTLFIKGEN